MTTDPPDATPIEDGRLVQKPGGHELQLSLQSPAVLPVLGAVVRESNHEVAANEESSTHNDDALLVQGFVAE